MIETYFLNNSLGYITIPKSLAVSGKITLDHLGQSAVITDFEGELITVIHAFLGNTKEESEIKARNWFTSRKLNIHNLEDWNFQDISNYARIFKTYNLQNNMIEDLKNLVRTTASSLDKNDRLTIAIYFMGLVGEIGETIEAYDISKKEFKTELADIVWYTVAISLMLETEHLLDEIDFSKKENDYYYIFPESDLKDLQEYLQESLKHLEKAKKYVRDYPSRPIDSLYGYIKPLKMISNVFDLSDSYEILEKKLGSRYPEGFNVQGIRE